MADITQDDTFKCLLVQTQKINLRPQNRNLHQDRESRLKNSLCVLFLHPFPPFQMCPKVLDHCVYFGKCPFESPHNMEYRKEQVCGEAMMVQTKPKELFIEYSNLNRDS